ncbi:MAG: monovalent cation/H(+) antiporter subunit G [Candidatus Hadarchaeum sp.]|uniref:monovalent cation/H(+) antiporter subunit G n=1 Tax=Candidatus Hadarchaeum sp. TaxID=2883567 RepID=UPI003D15086D
MIEYLAYLLLIIGSACSVIGAIGIVRFPDFYTRVHANTVVIVGGSILLILGSGISGGLNSFTAKAILIAIFIFLTNPVSSHALARAAHKSGVKLWSRSVADKLEEDKR